MNNPSNFIEAVKQKNVTIGIVGMGYVGLPLALEFCEKRHNVFGLDIDKTKVDNLNAGKSYIKHIPQNRISAAVNAGLFTAVTDFSRIKDVDAVLICVPTPLTKYREPDLSYIIKTAEAISPYLKAGQLITLESTTYPGTTEEILIPILEAGSGLKAGVDFWVAFSPEREDPNNPKYTTATIPKVIGGYTENCRNAAVALYSEIVVQTVPVSKCAAAEATKLLENIFRSVNIALVNELKVIFQRMDINIWEVIAAASTKPFGYMPFYPGPGLGGHCIPIDPFYLTWKAKEFGLNTRFIELAGEINTSMPEYVVHRVMEELNNIGKPLKGSTVLVVGVAYKPNVDDMRESPSLVLIELLEDRGAIVDFYDPYIPEIPMTREHLELAGRLSVGIDNLEKYDVVLLATNHSNIDYDEIQRKSSLIIDTRNAYPFDKDNIKRA